MVDRSTSDFGPKLGQKSAFDRVSRDICPLCGQNQGVDRSTAEFCLTPPTPASLGSSGEWLSDPTSAPDLLFVLAAVQHGSNHLRVGRWQQRDPNPCRVLVGPSSTPCATLTGQVMSALVVPQGPAKALFGGARSDQPLAKQGGAMCCRPDRAAPPPFRKGPSFLDLLLDCRTADARKAMSRVPVPVKGAGRSWLRTASAAPKGPRVPAGVPDDA